MRSEGYNALTCWAVKSAEASGGSDMATRLPTTILVTNEFAGSSKDPFRASSKQLAWKGGD
jgi:hypothetical protein